MLQKQPRLSTRKQNLLLKRFCIGDTAVKAAVEAGVSRNTANLYFNHFRELIWKYCRTAPRFHGEVEMDQAYFGKGVKRERKSATIKNPLAYGDEWRLMMKKDKTKEVVKKDKRVMVFGIFNRGGHVYTHIIKKADRKTLFPIIHMVVEPGSTIFTDKWAAYDSLKIDGYTHCQVNHSLGLASPEGFHTGHIESFWGQAKYHLARYKGISRRTFALHLKEIEVRHNYKGSFSKFMKALVKAPKISIDK